MHNVLLHRAASKGNLERCCELLKSRVPGFDINATDEDGRTCLQCAVEEGHEAVARLFLENGADCCTKDKWGCTPLWAAVENGDVAVLQLLIQYKALESCSGQEAHELVHLAADLGHGGAMRMLCQQGATIQCTPDICEDAYTPLHAAAKAGYLEVVEELVAAGADVNALDAKRHTPMFLASKSHHAQVLAYLSEHGGRLLADSRLSHSSDSGTHLQSPQGPLSARSLDASARGASSPDEGGGSASSPTKSKSNSSPALLGDGTKMNHVWGQLQTLERDQQMELVKMLLAQKGGEALQAADEAGDTLLHYTARMGDGQLVKQLLQEGAPIDAANKGGVLPLHAAVEKGHVDVARELMDNGADVNSLTKDGAHTALHLAASLGHPEMVGELLRRGAEPAQPDADGGVALHRAASSGNVLALHSLIAHAATTPGGVDAKDSSGCTALHLAALEGHLEAARFLLDSGATVDAVDEEGCSPLFFASREGHEELVKLLLAHGANPNLHNNDKETPLHKAVEEGNLSIVEDLLECGADVEVFDEAGYTPLRGAAADGNTAVVELLLDHGAHLDSLDKDGGTPLHAAAMSGCEAVAGVLLDRGSALHWTDEAGNTPLHWAAKNGHMGVIELLLGRGADINMKNQAGHTPMHVAAADMETESLWLLLQRGAQLEPGDQEILKLALLTAVEKADIDVVRRVMALGCDVNGRDWNGKSALHLCAAEGLTAIAEELLAHGAVVSCSDNVFSTPLHEAMRRHRPEMVKLLLTHGADPQALDEMNRSPVDCTADAELKELVARWRQGEGAHVPVVTQGAAYGQQAATPAAANADAASRHDAEGGGDEALAESLAPAPEGAMANGPPPRVRPPVPPPLGDTLGELGGAVFSYRELSDATECWSERLVIGRGSFGTVYKGTIRHTPLAIKKLDPHGSQGQQEFENEIKVLHNIRHPNIVMLIGYCPEPRRQCLVYEMMERGSLQDCLACENGATPLPWQTRLSIAVQAARGLLYLHSQPRPIVHRDLKSSNILINDNMTAKVGDTGLAKAVSILASPSQPELQMMAGAPGSNPDSPSVHGYGAGVQPPSGATSYKNEVVGIYAASAMAKTHVTETSVVGTMVYLDPEYLRSGHLSPKSDVYAFGMVLLELLTGREPRAGLTSTVEAAMTDGTGVKVSDICDPRAGVWPEAIATRLARLGLACMSLSTKDRPDLGTRVLPELQSLCRAGEAMRARAWEGGVRSSLRRLRRQSKSRSSKPGAELGQAAETATVNLVAERQKGEGGATPRTSPKARTVASAGPTLVAAEPRGREGEAEAGSAAEKGGEGKPEEGQRDEIETIHGGPREKQGGQVAAEGGGAAEGGVEAGGAFSARQLAAMDNLMPSLLSRLARIRTRGRKRHRSLARRWQKAAELARVSSRGNDWDWAREVATSGSGSDVELPGYYFCNITYQVMEDPVVAADGSLYERKAIKGWFDISNMSPVTGEVLKHKQLKPNKALREAINCIKMKVPVPVKAMAGA
eukprot:jgi/Mesvir1/9717/Mv12188-RA.1